MTDFIASNNNNGGMDDNDGALQASWAPRAVQHILPLSEKAHVLVGDATGTDMLLLQSSGKNGATRVVPFSKDALADTILVDERFFAPQPLDVGGLFQNRTDLGIYLSSLGVTTRDITELALALAADGQGITDLIKHERVFGSLSHPMKRRSTVLSHAGILAGVTEVFKRKSYIKSDWQRVLITAILSHVASPFCGTIVRDMPLTTVKRPANYVITTDAALEEAIGASVITHAFQKSYGVSKDVPESGVAPRALVPEFAAYCRRIAAAMMAAPSYAGLRRLLREAAVMALIQAQVVSNTVEGVDKVSGLPLDKVLALLRLHHPMAVEAATEAFGLLAGAAATTRSKALQARFNEAVTFFNSYPQPQVWIETMIGSMTTTLKGAHVRALSRQDARAMLQIRRFASRDAGCAALVITARPRHAGDRQLEVYSASNYRGSGLTAGYFELPAGDLVTASVARVALSADEVGLADTIMRTSLDLLGARYTSKTTMNGVTAIESVGGTVTTYEATTLPEADVDQLLSFIALDGGGSGLYFVAETDKAPRIGISYTDAFVPRTGLGADTMITVEPRVYLARSGVELPSGGDLPAFTAPLLLNARATGLLAHLVAVSTYEGTGLRGSLLSNFKSGIAFVDPMLHGLGDDLEAVVQTGSDGLRGDGLRVRMAAYTTPYLTAALSMLELVMQNAEVAGFSAPRTAFTRMFVPMLREALRSFLTAHPFLYLQLQQQRRRDPGNLIGLARVVLMHYVRAATVGRDLGDKEYAEVGQFLNNLERELEEGAESETIVLSLFSDTATPTETGFDPSMIHN